ncbi:MAG: transcription elongation factor Spt5 [Methanomethylophilus sp.]|nr:transcription elongation factor Spt5 [Methanomethylophilus sp.]
MTGEIGGPVFSGDSGSKNVHAGGAVYWNFQVSSAASPVNFAFAESTPDAENAPEWNVTLYDSTGTELWNSFQTRKDVDVELPGRTPKILKFEVICPKGARYDDSVSIVMTMKSEAGASTAEFGAIAKQSIVVLKTQIDQEKTVADSLLAKADQGEKDIYAILSPIGLRGYVFVEGMNTDQMHEKARDIKKARSFIDGETSIEEIGHYLTPVSAVVGIVEGDLVELVNGPFKGEMARVQKIDEAKEEITVELVQAMVPIPVTVKGDSVRIVEKEK